MVLDTESVKVEKYEPTVLGPEQTTRLLQAVSGERLEALWYVALGCRPREGEFLGLTWNRVDFVNHTITIAQTLQRQKQADGKNKTVIVPTTKGGRIRVIPMPLFVEQALTRTGNASSRNALK